MARTSGHFCTSYSIQHNSLYALRFCTGRTAHRAIGSFHDRDTRRGWGVSVTSRPLFTPWKDPVPIVQEAASAPGPVWTGAENLAPTGIRSPDRPTRSQSLYRLSYPAHNSLYGHDWMRLLLTSSSKQLRYQEAYFSKKTKKPIFAQLVTIYLALYGAQHFLSVLKTSRPLTISKPAESNRYSNTYVCQTEPTILFVPTIESVRLVCQSVACVCAGLQALGSSPYVQILYVCVYTCDITSRQTRSFLNSSIKICCHKWWNFLVQLCAIKIAFCCK
jgi:hypothetical protein